MSLDPIIVTSHRVAAEKLEDVDTHPDHVRLRSIYSIMCMSEHNPHNRLSVYHLS